MDIVSKDERSRMMASIRGRDTSPELALRRELWKRGARYRVDYGPERIDIAFPRRKLAVFVDGCFWHQCPIHGTVPSSNTEYWIPKLRANVERDRRRTAKLEAEGWTVVRIWEHELVDATGVADRIIATLQWLAR